MIKGSDAISDREKLSRYLMDLKQQSLESNLPKMTVLQLVKEVGIPKSTLYKNHKREIMEFKNIIHLSSAPSTRKLLLASRRENKTLRERVEILTAVAQELFIENESLKSSVISLKKNNITRIK